MAPSAPNNQPPPASPDLWRAILALGNGQAPAAVARADEIDRLGQAVTHPQFDAYTLNLTNQFRRQFVDLDLGKVYSMMPPNPQGDRRRLFFAGENRETEGYRFSFSPKEKHPGGAPLGRLNGQVSLEWMHLPQSGHGGYRADGKATVGMSGITYQQVAQVEDSELALMEQAAHASLWKAVHQAIPKTGAFLENFLTVDASRTEFKNDPAFGPYLDYDVTFRIKPQALADSYPKIHDYMESLGKLFHFQGTIWDDAGHALAQFEIDSEKGTLRLHFMTHDGAILPFDRHDRPASTGLHFADIRKKDFRMTLQGEVNLYGTTFTLRQYPLQVSFAADGGRARFSTCVNNAPQIVVGEILGYFPKGVADVFIPGTIDGNTKNFFEAVARGPEGRGSRLDTEFINAAGAQDGHWQGEFHVAVLDNALVRYVLQKIGEHLLPDDQTSDEVSRFTNQLSRDLSADYAAARPYLR